MHRFNLTTETVNARVRGLGGGLNEDKTVCTLGLRGTGAPSAARKVSTSKAPKGTVARSARLLGPVIAADLAIHDEIRARILAAKRG